METTSPLGTNPHSLYILPTHEHRLDGLTLLVLADGNRRGSSDGGYAGGARRVVSIAEHLARRADVATLVACILSLDNIAKRGDDFFFELYQEFVALGVAIATRGALVAAGVRLEVWGDLGALRARGGHAVDLADAIEAVVGMTAGVASPALRLVVGIGYGRDTARELDVDIVLRTGMEEPGVLRLSGLGTEDSVVLCASTTLWPEIEPREVDDVIELGKGRLRPRFSGGHGLDVIVGLVDALSTTELAAPVRVTIPTSAPPAPVVAALEHLFAGLLGGCATVAVEHAWGGGGMKRYGLDHGARHEIRIVGRSLGEDPGAHGELGSVLAPGQEGRALSLPSWLSLGHANVHVCGTAPEDMVRSIGEALRFAVAHPPLLGGDRPSTPASRSGDVGAVCPEVAERDQVGHRFTEKTMEWAASAGLMLPETAWRRAAANYALTGFFIHYRIPTEWDEAGTGWEEGADLTARYMILVAAGDEGIFDRVLAGETVEQRRARLAACAAYLQAALGDEGPAPLPPGVPGAELLAAIARGWRDVLGGARRVCHPAAAATFRRCLQAFYAASVAEHRAGIASGPRVGSGREDVDQRVAGVVEGLFAAAPAVIAARAWAQLRDALGGSRPAADELCVLVYLAEVASAIGAGLLFQAAALAAPAAYVDAAGLRCLDEAAALLDFHVRLSNDASGLLHAPGGDRDPKVNACTILVPGSTTGTERKAAIIQALVTCRRLAAWLEGEVAVGIQRVAAAWPSMGTWLRRGAFVGRRVYEVGHYTTISAAQMSAIFDEAEKALR